MRGLFHGEGVFTLEETLEAAGRSPGSDYDEFQECARRPLRKPDEALSRCRAVADLWSAGRSDRTRRQAIRSAAVSTRPPR